MRLVTGTRIGPYEVVALLGTGGMGEVYRARDTKLNRDVALKVLSAAFATDSDRLARLRREAQVLASLSHPNVGHIYGFEDGIAGHALVLELVEGATLAQRIAQGPILLSEALPIARQIADALDAAHEQGIVHRDLKPANIKVTDDGIVKVLDFGLAKAVEPASITPEFAMNSPTMSLHVTEAGVILGTAAYMSPEQARGKVVDKRTDIWAFGGVLYEMLTGTPAFSGQTTTDILAAVIEREPDWTRLPSHTPPAVVRVIQRCLTKDPKRRLRDIADARVELDNTETLQGGGVTHARPLRREQFAWMALVIAIAAVAGLAALAFREPPPEPEIRFETALPAGMVSNFAQLAISPDGQQLIVAPTFEGRAALWLRPLNSVAGRSLAGTEGAYLPFWSQDGRSIGFFADRKLKRIDLDSEAVADVTDVVLARGGAWQSDGTILFAPKVNSPLLRVSASGGQPVPVTHLEAGQTDHRLPMILPGGKHFIYYARGTPQARGVYVARMDGSEPRRLLDADVPAVYSGTGRLLFVRQGDLFAQEFDAQQVALTGTAYRVAGPVTITQGVSLASLSASAAGAIAYGAGDTGFRTQFAWFDRAGKRLGNLGTPDNTPNANPALSPDGRYLGFSRIVAGNWDVWLLDMRGSQSRVTSDPGLDFNPTWSPDSRRIFYSSTKGMFSQLLNDTAGPEQLLSSGAPTDVSADGRFLLYDAAGSASQPDIWVLPLVGDRTPRALTQSPFGESAGQFSPDGKWVAYQSNQPGQAEIYLQPFPGPGTRIQVSSGGGEQVRWGPRGSELLYVAADRRLTAVSVTFNSNGESVDVGQPMPLFPTAFDRTTYQRVRPQYAISPDGQRFLMNVPTDVREPSSIVVILNWKGKP